MTGIRNARANGKKLGRPKRGVDRERFLELKEQGQSLTEIAPSLGVGYGTVSARLLTSHVAPETSAGPIGTDDGLEVRIFGDVAVTTFYRIGTVMYDKRTVGNWRIGMNLIFDSWASHSAVHFQLPLARTKFNPEDRSKKS